MFADSCLVSATNEQLSSNLGGEAVILDLKSGEYFGLNTVAARVWELVQSGMTVGAVRDRLVEEFEVDQQQCSEDLSELLESMVSAGLVRVSEPAAQA